MIYALLALCGILSLISAMSYYYPIKIAAGFSWWAFFVYWLSADIVVDGSPTDIIIMLVLMFLGVLFLLWGLSSRRGRVDVEEERIIGGKTQRVKYNKANNPKRSSGRETAEEYQQRAHRAVSKRKRR